MIPTSRTCDDLAAAGVARAATPRICSAPTALGRDVLSRLIYGARVAMLVAVFASLGAMLLGSVLAYIAGYFGGWIDG